MTVVGLADLVRLSDEVWLTPTVAVEVFEVTVPLAGSRPDAEAELLMVPLLMSAWLTV